MSKLAQLIAADPKLEQVLRDTEVAPLDLTTDVYGRLLRAIVFQQLSGKAASTIYERFLHLFPEEYPEPEVLLELDLPTLRAAGLSRQKAVYLQNVAGHFVDRGLRQTDWSSWSDDAILQEFTQIKGVGEWTVQMMLIFALGRPDVLPTADLAIQQSMQYLYGLDGRGKQLARQMLDVAAAWRPHRSLVIRHLWRWWGTIV